MPAQWAALILTGMTGPAREGSSRSTRSRIEIGTACVVVAAIVVTALLARHRHDGTGSAHAGTPPRHVRAVAAEQPDRVVYELFGQAQRALVTYTAADGNTEQTQWNVRAHPSVADAVDDFTGGGSALLYLSAQNTDGLDAYTGLRGNESITCRIVVDGRTVVEHTAYGQGTIVTCQAPG